VLGRCALVAGANGLFVETHPSPDQAMSDGPNMIPLGEMAGVLKAWLRVWEAVH
jgi:2-dehydro-3-deoxyphosphooctonate aldolase (KDO 8-P synthase)